MEEVKVYDLNSYGQADERGWMYALLDGPWGENLIIKNLHLGSIAPGQVRGNHYHEKQKEWFCVFGGEAELAWENSLGQVVVRKLAAQEVILVEIPAGLSHAFKNTGQQNIFVCGFTEPKYNRGNPDRIEKIILK